MTHSKTRLRQTAGRLKAAPAAGDRHLAVPVTAPPDGGADGAVESLLRWSLDRFDQDSTLMTTGFGMEGCALIDMLARCGASVRVIYLDTGFFFAETHELIGRLRSRYPSLSFSNEGTGLTPRRQAQQYGDRLWETDPDRCCTLRKVEPMKAALAGAQLWMTALRRSQSASRQSLQVLEWSWRYSVLKFSPLASWSRRQVLEYVRRNEVPYNALHDRGYPSVGCTHCTRPVAGSGPGDYSRAGRWAGRDKSECGLHLQENNR